MTAHSNHARLVEPATQDEQNCIHSHQNKRPAGKCLHYRPLTTPLLELHVTSRVSARFQVSSGRVVRKTAIVVLDIVEGGVFPVCSIVDRRVVEVVLDD